MWDFLVQKGSLECLRETLRNTSKRRDQFELESIAFDSREVLMWFKSNFELFVTELFLERFEWNGSD